MTGRHIVWDWNGTLLGDGGILIDSVIAAFAATGLSPRAVAVADHQRHFTRPIADFFDRLAGRPLTEAEHRLLASAFDRAYAERDAELALTPDASRTLRDWAAAGNTQSLLSMTPHEQLLPAVRRHGVAGLFSRVDGARPGGPDTKDWHLREHLAELDAPADLVVLVGDTTDDLLAARAAGVDFVLYHSGPTALQSLDHFDALGPPVARTLAEAAAVAARTEVKDGRR